mgnify:CR=1 FL=1
MKNTACKDCGIIIEIDEFDDKHQYSCPRCKTVFYRPGESFTLVSVMAISSLLFFIPVTFLPIMSLEILDQTHSITILEAVWFFIDDGYIVITIIAAASGVIIPVILLTLILTMTLTLKLGSTPDSFKNFYRLYMHLSSWAMAEVYLISIFVAIVKLSGMAELTIDFGLLSFFFFIVTFYITIMWFNPNDLWKSNAI